MERLSLERHQVWIYLAANVGGLLVERHYPAFVAALLVDEVLPREPVRQWVLSVPCPLRYLLATDPVAMGAVLGIA